jgi:hypothetical protein
LWLATKNLLRYLRYLRFRRQSRTPVDARWASEKLAFAWQQLFGIMPLTTDWWCHSVTGQIVTEWLTS